MKSEIKEKFSELDSNISLLNGKVHLEDNTKNYSEKTINILNLKINTLYLSVRSANCLHKMKIKYVGDLVQFKESELLKVRNLGRKSLRELKEYVSDLGLSFGMEIQSRLSDGEGKIIYYKPEDISKRRAKEALKEKITFLFIPIKDLDLSVRSANCLHKMKIKYLGDLVQLRESELLKVRNFGRKSLRELKQNLSDLGLSFGIKIRGWTPEKIKILSIKYREKIKEKNNQLAIKYRHSLNVNVKYLEDELLYIFCSLVRTDRNKKIVTKFYGWDGRGKRTLEKIGEEFGLTRERVRQIILRFEKRFNLNKKKIIYSLPILDSSLQIVADNIPDLAESIEYKLFEKRISKNPFHLDGLISCGKLTGMAVPFSIVNFQKKRFVVEPGLNKLPKTIYFYAKRIIEHLGVATISDVYAQINEEIKQKINPHFIIKVISLVNDVNWLDDSKEWFWFNIRPRRNRLRNLIKKTCSISSKIDISELRKGVARNHRMEGFAPPRQVLLNFCKTLPWCKIEGSTVTVDSNLNWEKVLDRSSTEWAMAAILKEYGPIMSRVKLQEKCFEVGMGQVAFFSALSNSPIITKFAPGVYGLRGAKSQPGTIESLKPKREPKKVVLDYGWTRDGKIWIGNRVSESIMLSGVCGIPSSMKNFLQGNYSLQAADGVFLGDLKIKDNSLWSVTPFFKRRGGEIDDYIVLTFDLKSREAKCYIGDIDLFDDFIIAE